MKPKGKQPKSKMFDGDKYFDDAVEYLRSNNRKGWVTHMYATDVSALVVCYPKQMTVKIETFDKAGKR